MRRYYGVCVSSYAVYAVLTTERDFLYTCCQGRPTLAGIAAGSQRGAERRRAVAKALRSHSIAQPRSALCTRACAYLSNAFAHA